MTKREFLEIVANSSLNEEVKAFALDEIGKLDTKNAQKRAKNAEKHSENAPLIATMREMLYGKVMFAKDIATVLGVSTSKVVSILTRDMANEVRVIVGKGKVSNSYTID